MSTAGFLAVGHSLTPFVATLDGLTRRYVKTSAAVVPGGTVNGIAFSADGAYLAAAYASSPRIRVYATSDWSQISGTPTLPATGNAVDFNPAGTRLAVAHNNTPFLTIINTSDWTTVSATPTLPNSGLSCKFSHSGTYLAVGHANATAVRVTIINTSDWTVAQTLETSNSGLGVSWSHDDAMLAVAHNDGKRLTVFDTSDWSVISATPDLAAIGTANACAFSPDSTVLAIAHGSSPRLTMLNTSGWTTISDTVVPEGIALAVAYSPDSRLAVAFDTYPWVKILDKMGQSVLWEPGYFPGTCRALAWSKAPPAGTLSGTTLDETEAPVQREVLVIRDSTNDVVSSGLSNPTTGVFSLPVPASGGHTVLMREASGRVRVIGGGVTPV